MFTPTLEEFLKGIHDLLRSRNSRQLRNYMLVEPPLPEIYYKLTFELRRAYPGKSDQSLEQKYHELFPEEEDGDGGEAQGTAWPGFLAFLTEYLRYLRDVNVENLLETHDQLSGVVNQCITALGHPSKGILLLPTCLYMSAALAKLAVNLERKPELTAHLLRRSSTTASMDDPESNKTLVEHTAELLQRAFTTCLTDRSPSGTGVNRAGKPEGKKVGIYSFANLVLKLLFQCQKMRLATQIFTNVAQHSPPLSIFPASQRVTYLYYLGRFYFSNNHFYRAQMALDGAYHQCHARCLKQRNLILTYLICANLILGRFPSDKLLQRPEARDLGPKFWSICRAIVKGDLGGLKPTLDGTHHTWFIQKGLYLPLLNRCEVLIWRSLARTTFLLTGTPGDDKRAASFALHDMMYMAQVLEHRAKNPPSTDPTVNGRVHVNHIFNRPPAGTKTPKPIAQEAYVDPDFAGVEGADDQQFPPSPSMNEVICVLCSLVDQGFLHGFISHKLGRFAIVGAKSKPALEVGFPLVWHVIRRKAKAEQAESPGDWIPGWVKHGERSDSPNPIVRGSSPGMGRGRGRGRGRGVGPGMVVHLTGARPAGAPPA
ncbi:MAG: hypothetical protein M1816_001884 [Peltula sp. TS41687]|nr:MAG: hypothetical protein M1816_001884 [Peltula sp. TS41687]